MEGLETTISKASYNWSKQDCPTCEIPATKFLGKRGGKFHREKFGVETEIWSCGTCGLIFPNPMPYPIKGLRQHYDVGADDYFSSHDKDDRLQGAAALVKKAELLLGRKGRLLDVGVGRGEVLIAASERGWEVEGIEPSETFADYAEKSTGAKIWRESIEESDLTEASYDVVILAAVLEHLYDPDIVIKKIASALKQGGILFLDVPNEKGLYFRVGNLYQKLRGRNWSVNLAPTFTPYHIFGFSPKSLKKLLGKHGLKPKVWNVYAGTSLVPTRTGFVGTLESQASKIVTAISSLGEMGTYIETWAEKE